MKPVNFIALFLLLAAAHAMAAPVAMITDLKGKVSVIEGGKARPATLLTYLAPDNRLQLEAGAQVVLTYFSKPLEVTLAGPADATIATDGAQVSKGAKPLIRSLGAERVNSARRFEPVAREQLALATVHMRASAKPAPRPTYPSDTAIVSITPALEWAELPAATGYRILLKDAAGVILIDETVARPPLAITAKHALKPGASYEWRVEAKLASGTPPSAETKFSVLATAQAKALKAAQPKPGDSFSTRLLYAARLQAEGLNADAKRLWTTLAAERPEDENLKQLATP